MKKIIFKKLFKDIFFTFFTFLFIMSTIVLTVQAVNFFDFVTEDGHSLKIYFFYTLLNFPKIFSRVLPFIFFLTLFYILISYEKKNELNIFWINGITKIEFLNKLIIFTLSITIFQIFLTSYLSPASQLKGRNFLKSSNIDFFTSLLKEGKFINITKNLTLFIENEDKNRSYRNIFIEDTRSNNSRMIFAKRGILIDNDNEKKFQLFDGRVINNRNSDLSVFDFNEIDFQLKKLNSKTIVVPKIQEINTIGLINCLRNKIVQNYQFRCEQKLKTEIKKELFKRIYKPIFLFLIAALTCFLLLKNKKFLKIINRYYLVFLANLVIIIYSEISLRYFAVSSFLTISALIIPLILFFVTYIIFYFKSNHA